MKTISLLLPLMILAAGAVAAPQDARYQELEKRYVREFLRRHPVVSTYLGGAGLDPGLAAADGALRDWSPAALGSEAELWRSLRGSFAALVPAELSPRHRIDREVALHQLDFMLHQDQERKYWQRALDTYVNEAFRGLDWYAQGMKDLGSGRYGTEAEWRTATARVAAVPAYLVQARRNLRGGRARGQPAGLAHGRARRPPVRGGQRRILREDAARHGGGAHAGPALRHAPCSGICGARGADAARAFRDFGAFVQSSLATLAEEGPLRLRGEGIRLGAAQQPAAWPRTAAELYESSLAGGRGDAAPDDGGRGEGRAEAQDGLACGRGPRRRRPRARSCPRWARTTRNRTPR